MNISTTNHQISIWNKFTNQYSLSKTLRFELKPIGKTKDLVRKIKKEQDLSSPLAPLILQDEERTTTYKKVKRLIDKLHCDFLDFALSNNQITKEEKDTLFDKTKNFFTKYKANKKDKTIATTQKDLAKILIKILNTNAPKFLETLSEQKEYLDYLKEKEEETLKNLNQQNKLLSGKIQDTPKSDSNILNNLKEDQKCLKKEIDKLNKALKKYENIVNFKFDKAKLLYSKTDTLFTLLRLYYIKDKEATQLIAEFDDFKSYFTGFNKNRANIYNIKGDGKDDNFHFLSTSIAHRLFEENLKFHCDNIIKWKTFEENLKKFCKIKIGIIHKSFHL